MSKVDWTRYDYCQQCDALEGQGCWDLRYAWRGFHADRPHRGRRVMKGGRRVLR